MIDQAETKNEDATRNVINRYFDFGEALYLRYKELKPSYVRTELMLLLKKKLGNKFPKQNFLMMLCEREGKGRESL
jgi:hypothetical protein